MTRKQQNCPICGKPEQPSTRPFCSARCAQIDLGRWLSESYRVPASVEREPVGDESGDEQSG